MIGRRHSHSACLTFTVIRLCHFLIVALAINLFTGTAAFASCQQPFSGPAFTFANPSQTVINTGFFGLRYLNPDAGRFWTTDTYNGNRSQPLSLHKYLYASDNPSMVIDPTGLLSVQEEVEVAGEVGQMARIAAPSIRALPAATKTLVISGSVTTIGALALVSGLLTDVSVQQVLNAQRELIKTEVGYEKDKHPNARILYHYTDEGSSLAILADQFIEPSAGAWNPIANKRHPVGAYATDIEPWTPGITQAALANLLYFSQTSANSRLSSGSLSWFVVLVDEDHEFQRLPWNPVEFYKPTGDVRAVLADKNPMP